MTKPGPMPWAENDTYAGGPDIGSNTKTSPLAVHQDDGYYRSRRPGPDILNWQLNRAHLTQRYLARLQAMNWTIIETDTTDYNGGNLLNSCHGLSSGAMQFFMFYYDAVAGVIDEIRLANSRTFAVPLSSPCTPGGSPLSSPLTLDADHDNGGRRIIVANDGAVNDMVRYAAGIGAGAWATVTFTAGAPTLLWNAVGCDRDTAGSGNALWLIGDDAGGGNPAVWSSSDGVNFAVVATFPGATLGEAISGIFHSCHPSGALGPDDSGNPTWLILSDTYATYSADGSSFTATAHSLALSGGSFNARSAAYSRTSGRWVVVLPAATGGDVAYSDDNGATWTTLSGVLDPGTTDEPMIAGDGHGTFVIAYEADDSLATVLYVSTDEGLTWSSVRIPSSHLSAAGGTLDGTVLEGVFDEDKDVDEVSTKWVGFLRALYADGTPDTEIHRSLVT